MAKRKQRMDLSGVVKRTGDYLVKRKIQGIGRPGIGSDFSPGDVTMWIPSGISVVDYVLGGGLPIGRISEVFSLKTSEGKTSLLIHFATQVHRAGGIVVWLEAEHALDKARAERLGMRLDRTIIWAPAHCEDGFEFIGQVIEQIRSEKGYKKAPILIVWDTIAATPTRAERAGDSNKEGMGRKARVIRAGLRTLTQDVWLAGVHLCMVNHTFQTFQSFGLGYETHGGGGIKLHASLRIELKYTAPIKDPDSGQPLGIKTRIRIMKNKLAVAGRLAELCLLGDTGYDDVSTTALAFLNASMDDYVWVPKKAGAEQKGWYRTKYVDQETGEIKTTPSFRWRELHDKVAKYPGILEYWGMGLEELWPIPEDRTRGPERDLGLGVGAGWFVPRGAT